MKRKRRTRRALKTLKVMFITALMMFAAASGIYCAKLYTTPYSNIVSDFHEDTLDEVEISKEKCNILIMGVDKNESLTDVMMLAQIDPERDSAVVMSIPRDTRVKYGGRWMKMNEPHAIGHKNGKKGSEAAIIAVKELTGIPINHFVKVNINAFSDCIDELGGVDFDVPQRMKYSDPAQGLKIDLQKGFQHLDGDKSEQLVRFRRYPNGDIDRIKVQQEFLHSIAQQKLQMKYILKVPDIYKIIIDNMETSMTPEDIVQCGKQMLTIGAENIQTMTLPGSAQYVGEVSYVIPDYSAISQVRETAFGYAD